MYRLLVTIIINLLVSVSFLQAQEDIILKINDVPVYKSEFMAKYKGVPSASVNNYLPWFIDYKIRVMEGKSMGLDTLSTFKLLLASKKGKLLLDKNRRNIYKEPSNNRFVNNRWVRIVSIDRYLSQKCSAMSMSKCKSLMDSIAHSLKNGADFDEMALKYSDNKQSHLPIWQRENLCSDEVIDAINSSAVNDIVGPVASAVGYHIIKVLDKSTDIPAQVKDSLIKRDINSYVGTEIYRDVAMYDDTDVDDLLYELSLGDGEKVYTPSEKEILEYYKDNISDYYYSQPHFKGAVIYCQSKKIGKVIKKYLKKISYDDWEEAVRKLTLDDGKIKIEKGVFKEGDNDGIDRYVFKKNKQINYSEGLTYSFVVGKKLKKKPDSYKDVIVQLKTDIVNNKRLNADKNLVDKYKVEINKDVLKTVNNSGSN